MPRITKAQIEQLLASLHAARNDRNKAQKLVDQYETELTQIPASVLKEGVYGSWMYGLTAGKSITDAAALNKLLADHKLEMPKRLSKPSIIAKPIEGAK